MGIERIEDLQGENLEELLARWHEGDPVDRIRRAKTGDEAAIVEVVTLMHPYALAVAGSLMPGSAEAEDLAQQTMLKALIYLNRFRNQNAEAFPNWISRVVKNDVVRAKRKMERSIPTDPHILDEMKSSDEPFEDESIRVIDHPRLEHAMRTSIGALSGSQRTVMLGLTGKGIFPGDDHLLYKQLARRDGIPVGSIGPTRRRAFTHLRPALREFRG